MNLFRNPQFEYEKFHIQTKTKKFNKQKKSTLPNLFRKSFYKGYSRFNHIPLGSFGKLPDISLFDALQQRVSFRNYSEKTLPLKSLSTLLYFSAGLKLHLPKSFFHRFYPSAGARYPLELYLVPLKVKNLPSGLYHYYPKNHSLEELLRFNRFNFNKYFDQDWIKKCGTLIIITGIFKRTTLKYGERGYRYVLFEAGHLMQNIYLIATSLNVGCCSVGGFLDDQIDNLIDIDGINETVLCILAIGKK